MKKKLLPLAILAGLAGAAGTAQAVHVNSEGLGETLIYPFYSAESANDTYVTVVNTTNKAKAVKVRFLEAMNSKEVLDFNLYLSPYDHWAGAITRGEGDVGAKLVTGDTSCTVPAIPAEGQPFRKSEFSDDSVNGLERTLEGYVEVIEMGELGEIASDGTITEYGTTNIGATADTKHGADGSAPNCSVVTAAWVKNGASATNFDGTAITGTEAWGVLRGTSSVGDPEVNLDVPGGGLYGYGVIINTEEGTNATYDAIALDNFYDGFTIQHTTPGSLDPGLDSGMAVSAFFDGGDVVETVFDSSNGVAAGLNAVSSLFMHKDISNDYVTSYSIEAGTDWVLNMPTKQLYVNQTPVVAPFTNTWDTAESVACEVIGMAYWDREEQDPTVPPVTGELDFSPLPELDEVEIDPSSVCAEASILSFYNPEENADVGHISPLESSTRITYGFTPEFDKGWARIDFTTQAGRTLEGSDADSGLNRVFNGLPVVGFAVQKYTNNNVSSYFAGTSEHKSTRWIENSN
jgi:hypothetical protein